MSRILLTVAITSIFGMVAGVLIFGGECLYWLKHGFWPAWDLADQLGSPVETSYIGLNAIVKWYFAERLSAVVFFSATAVFCISIYASTALEDS